MRVNFNEQPDDGEASAKEIKIQNSGLMPERVSRGGMRHVYVPRIR